MFVVEHSRTQYRTLHVAVLLSETPSHSILKVNILSVANSQCSSSRTSRESRHSHIAMKAERLAYTTNRADSRLHFPCSIRVHLNRTQTLVGATCIFALPPVAILGMVAYCPGKAYGRRAYP